MKFFIISKQDFTIDDENEMLEDLVALMGDDVGGEGEWRSPYYSLGKRSSEAEEGRSKRFTVDFNGMQVSNDSFHTFAAIIIQAHFISYSVEGPCADDVCKFFG